MTNITCGCAMRWEIGKTGPLCDYIEHFLGYHKHGIVVKLATDQFKYQVLKVSHRLLVTHHPQKYDVEGIEYSIPEIDPIPLSDYSYFQFEDKVNLSSKNFDYAKGWQDSWYLVSVPLKRSEESDYQIYQEHMCCVYLDQYAPVTLVLIDERTIK